MSWNLSRPSVTASVHLDYLIDHNSRQMLAGTQSCIKAETATHTQYFEPGVEEVLTSFLQ